MANLYSKIRLRRKRAVIYSLEKNILIENNSYTNTIFYYDIFKDSEKLFFQTRLKHNAKYEYNVKIDSYLLFYLRFIKWL